MERPDHQEPILKPNIDKVIAGKKYQVGIIADTRNLDAEARDQAQDNLNQDFAESKRKAKAGEYSWHEIPTIKRLWKHNWAKEFYQQKEIQKVKSELRANSTGSDNNPEQKAVVERFLVGASEDLARNGETKTIKNSPEDLILKDQLMQLLIQYAEGDGSPADKDNFIRLKNRLLYEGLKKTKRGFYRDEQGKTHFGIKEHEDFTEYQEALATQADNLLQVAEQIHQAKQEGRALNRLDEELVLIGGRAKAGVKTEAHYTAAERIIDKMRGSRLTGWLVNEPVLALATTGAINAIQRYLSGVSRSRTAAIASFGAGALVGGTLQAIRTSTQLKAQRAEHARDRAKGEIFDSHQELGREQFRPSFYHTTSIKKLIDDLQSHLDSPTLGTPGHGPETHKAERLLASIEANQEVSTKKGIDLITYSSPDQIEQEKLLLLKLTNQLKRHPAIVAETERYRDNGNAPYASMKQELVEAIEKNIAHKDRIFNKMKNKKMLSSGLKSFGIGLGLGWLAHELGFGHAKQEDHTIHQAAVAHTETPVVNPSLNHDDLSDQAKAFMESTPVPPPHPISAAEYLQLHEDYPDLVRVHHEGFGFLDNDTPKFDGNELKLHLGGVHGSGIDADGNYVYDVTRMVKDSTHGEYKVIPLDLAHDHQLELFLTLSNDTQGQAFRVPFDASGHAVIDRDSEIGRLLFNKDSSGQLNFRGRFAEVAEVVGTKDGVVQIHEIATDEGPGIDHINEIDPRALEKLKTVLSPKIPVPETIPAAPVIPTPAVEQLATETDAWYPLNVPMSEKPLEPTKPERRQPLNLSPEDPRAEAEAIYPLTDSFESLKTAGDYTEKNTINDSNELLKVGKKEYTPAEWEARKAEIVANAQKPLGERRLFSGNPDSIKISEADMARAKERRERIGTTTGMAESIIQFGAKLEANQPKGKIEEAATKAQSVIEETAQEATSSTLIPEVVEDDDFNGNDTGSFIDVNLTVPESRQIEDKTKEGEGKNKSEKPEQKITSTKDIVTKYRERFNKITLPENARIYSTVVTGQPTFDQATERFTEAVTTIKSSPRNGPKELLILGLVDDQRSADALRTAIDGIIKKRQPGDPIILHAIEVKPANLDIVDEGTGKDSTATQFAKERIAINQKKRNSIKISTQPVINFANPRRREAKPSATTENNSATRVYPPEPLRGTIDEDGYPATNTSSVFDREWPKTFATTQPMTQEYSSLKNSIKLDEKTKEKIKGRPGLEDTLTLAISPDLIGIQSAVVSGVIKEKDLIGRVQRMITSAQRSTAKGLKEINIYGINEGPQEETLKLNATLFALRKTLPKDIELNFWIQNQNGKYTSINNNEGPELAKLITDTRKKLAPKSLQINPKDLRVEYIPYARKLAETNPQN